MKMNKEELEDYIHELCITENDRDYFVNWQSDDQGLHICVYIEESIEDSLLEKIQSLSTDHKIVVMTTPIGYIGMKFQN